MRRACLNGNIISSPVVTDAKVFVTTIIGIFQCISRQNWQSVTRTASERWDIDLVKEIRRDVDVSYSLGNLIIEIRRIKFRCTHFSSSFRKGLRQHHELMQRIQCCLYALINIARIARDEYCLFGLWLRCSRWWNQAYQRWLTVHAVSGMRAWIKSTVCLTAAKRRWPIIRIDPYFSSPR